MTGPYASSARDYHSNGWANPIPVREKRFPPRGFTGYEGADVTATDISSWIEGPEAAHNIGLRMSGTIGIDIDAHDGEVGAETMTAARAALGDLPPTWSSTSRGQGESRILLFRLPDGVSDRNKELAGAETALSRFGRNVEILHRGHRYAIVAPSMHPETRQEYRWYAPDGGPCEVPEVDQLPRLPVRWWELLTSGPDSGPDREQGKRERGPDVADWPFMTSTDLARLPEVVPRTPKTAEVANALLGSMRERYLNSTTEGSGRTQQLNNLALMYGHGVPEFWTAEQARDQMLADSRDNGFMAAHGERTALVQIERGLADGQRAEQWSKITYAQEAAAVSPENAPVDAVEALLREFLTPDQMEQAPPPRPLVKGYLNLDSESWLIGPAGSKKSFLALDFADHVAGGMPWHGRRVHQGPVVYIAA